MKTIFFSAFELGLICTIENIFIFTVLLHLKNIKVLEIMVTNYFGIWIHVLVQVHN